VGSLSIQLRESAESTLQRIDELAKNHGIEIQHDGQSGEFSHMGVSGTFTIKGDVVEVEFTKPALLPQALIDEQIRKVFGGL
jgi:hypothetical protein